MKNIIIYLILFTSFAFAQTRVRTDIRIPDIKNFKTLKCDFHMHTVFSDGLVWPSVRVEEAWREGLDVIALTDHIEYQPHKKDVSTNLNRPFDIAANLANELQLILIKGSEITRGMPPGHFNAIFLNDAEKLRNDDFMESFKEAKLQNAFVTWNHPGWKQKNNVPIWHSLHDTLLQNDLFKGIEIVNEYDYYPKAFKWALENGLTIMGNSDVHDPMNLQYDVRGNEHRAITLVFAMTKSIKAVKNALLDGRTAVYFGNKLLGKKEFLEPIFQNSLEILNNIPQDTSVTKFALQIKNSSDIDYHLRLVEKEEGINVPESITLFSNRTVLFNVKKKSGSKKYKVLFEVENLIIAPQKHYAFDFEF